MEDFQNNPNSPNQELVIPEPLQTPFAKPPSDGEVSGGNQPAQSRVSGKRVFKFIIILLIIIAGVIGGYFALSNYFPQYAKYVRPYLGSILDPVTKRINSVITNLPFIGGTPVASPTPTLTPSQITDSDDDGLSDSDEARYGTNPNNPDTDGDGYPDGEEVQNGYNPLGPGRLGSINNVGELSTKKLAEIPSEYGKFFFEDGVVFSSNKQRVAYKITEIRGNEIKAFVVVDGNKSRTYNSIGNLIFSLDSKKFAFVAKEGIKTFLVIDGQEKETQS